MPDEPKLSPAEQLAAEKGEPRKRHPKQGRWACGIYKRRTALGLTLDEVAAGAKVSRDAAYHIEHGSDPLLSTARKLAAFFGTTTDELWNEK